MYAEVIADISNVNTDKVFDYRIPEDLKIVPGMRVLVPFGNKNREGIVIKLKESSSIENSKIKNIIKSFENYPALTTEQLDLARDIKEKFKSTFAQALRLMIPAQMRGGRVSERKNRTIILTGDKKLLSEYLNKNTKKDGIFKYPKQKEIIDALTQNYALNPKQFSSSSVSTLIKHKIIYYREEQSYRLPFSEEILPQQPNNLTEMQRRVLEKIKEYKSGKFLLHGVTGSGKTEIYIRIIEECLKENKTAVLLVPEISLTAQTYMALKERIDVPIAVFHSGLSAGERFDEWRRVRTGEARVVLGARSAIFAPLENIGVIIIDEEHESSYKADTFPPYNTLEIAEYRANYNNAKLILGSATPSVLTRYKAENDEYIYLKMPERVLGRSLPEISIIDMREELMNGNRSIISGVLYNAIKEALDNSQQIMLFLNRRGYSTFEMCRACGYVVKCEACDISMTYHKNEDILKCHYCGRTAKTTEVCPQCGKSYLKQFGTGTQQAEEQVKQMFPDAKVLRMDADTMNSKNSYYNAYKTFEKGEADILIGTQMITQGFDFDNVTVSAVLAADTMLNLPDYRSAEESFRQMVQVAGRAGRKKAGKVFIQTYHPDNYAVKYAKEHDYDSFYKHEASLRKLNKLPPYSQFVKIQFSGEKEEDVVKAVKDCLNKLKTVLLAQKSDIINVYASESSVKRINNNYRYHILLNLKLMNNQLLNKIRDVISNLSYKGILVGVDVNPNGYM